MHVLTLDSIRLDGGVEAYPIPGHPGYAITREGAVYSCLTNKGKPGIKWRRRAVKINSDGYNTLALHGNGKRCESRIARLLLETFDGPPPEGGQACHINGIRTDDRLENLRWGTARDNAKDRDRHGTTVRGERVPQSKLTEEEVRSIRRHAGTGATQRALARAFRVDQQVVWAIIHRKRWTHVK